MLDTETSVDPSNRAQARAWDGDDGAYWAEHAQRLDRSMAGYRRPFLDAAAIDAGEQVLDVGCGTGQTTRDAARRAGAAGGVLGVDLSARMIDHARSAARAAGLSRVDFVRADAQIHPFPAGRFDVAISRTGAMFFGDPPAAFGNIRRALRPGGRLALLTWQPAERNEWFGEFARTLTGRSALPAPPPGAPHPFSLAEPAHVQAVLTGAGFADVRLAEAGAPLHFGPDAAAARELLLGLLGWMLPAEPPTRRRALRAFDSTLDAHTTAAGVHFGSAAWIVTAHRP